MVKRIGPDKARDLLVDRDPNNYFWLKDGRVLKNLHELHDAAGVMDDATFRHHVAENKNDFSNWVLNVHKDEGLAKKLSEASTQKEVQKMVKRRIRHLEGAMAAQRQETKKMAEAIRKPVSKTAKRGPMKAVKSQALRKIAKPQLAPHTCPPHYFLKCSSVHFILGVLAGFLLGFVIAFTI